MGVDRDRDLADFFLLEHAHENREHDYRKIVHAVIAGILEEVQGDRLARAGEAADENEFHQAEHNEGGAGKQPAA